MSSLVEQQDLQSKPQIIQSEEGNRTSEKMIESAQIHEREETDFCTETIGDKNEVKHDDDAKSLHEYDVKSESSMSREAIECNTLRKELKESKEKCESIEKERITLQSELDRIVVERDFLVVKLENSEKHFQDRLDQDLRKMKEQTDDLLEERVALLKKIGTLQLNKNKPKASTRTQGTQADFTVSIVGMVDDSGSVRSKMSGVSSGSKSERSAISGISMDTMGTSDSKSIKMHASKVISLARNFLGRKPKKGAVSNVPETDPAHSLGTSGKKSMRPPIPRTPRRNKLPTRPPRPRSKNEEQTSPPSKLPLDNAEVSNTNPKSSSKDKKKSKSSKKSGGSKPLSFKETPEDMEFYLPMVNLDGSPTNADNRHNNPENDTRKKDPTAIENVLRPWQVEFLESVQITSSSQLVFASKYKSKEIAKAMVKWRTERKMKHMRSKACAVALHIWTRTIEAKIRSSLLERKTSAEQVFMEKRNATLASNSKYNVFELATEV